MLEDISNRSNELNKKMFNDIGKKIKSLTRVIVWIEIIAFIIAGIVMFILATDANKHLVGLFIGLGLIFLIIGPLLSWIIGCFMYGFGELVDKTCDIQNKVCSSNNIQKNNDGIQQKISTTNTAFNIQHNNNVNQHKTPAVHSTKNVQVHSFAKQNVSAKPETLPNGTIKCPVCNLIQPDDRETCWQCGTKLKNE